MPWPSCSSGRTWWPCVSRRCVPRGAVYPTCGVYADAPVSPRIRRLGAADLDAADAILRATFDAGRSYRWRIERYLGIQPDGWLIAEDGGACVGMVGAGRWGAF